MTLTVGVSNNNSTKCTLIPVALPPWVPLPSCTLPPTTPIPFNHMELHLIRKWTCWPATQWRRPRRLPLPSLTTSSPPATSFQLLQATANYNGRVSPDPATLFRTQTVLPISKPLQRLQSLQRLARKFCCRRATRNRVWTVRQCRRTVLLPDRPPVPLVVSCHLKLTFQNLMKGRRVRPMLIAEGGLRSWPGNDKIFFSLNCQKLKLRYQHEIMCSCWTIFSSSPSNDTEKTAKTSSPPIEIPKLTTESAESQASLFGCGENTDSTTIELVEVHHNADETSAAAAKAKQTIHNQTTSNVDDNNKKYIRVTTNVDTLEEEFEEFYETEQSTPDTKRSKRRLFKSTAVWTCKRELCF